jgi:hypothetical protein
VQGSRVQDGADASPASPTPSWSSQPGQICHRLTHYSDRRAHDLHPVVVVETYQRYVLRDGQAVPRQSQERRSGGVGEGDDSSGAGMRASRMNMVSAACSS